MASPGQALKRAAEEVAEPRTCKPHREPAGDGPILGHGRVRAKAEAARFGCSSGRVRGLTSDRARDCGVAAEREGASRAHTGSKGGPPLRCAGVKRPFSSGPATSAILSRSCMVTRARRRLGAAAHPDRTRVGAVADVLVSSAVPSDHAGFAGFHNRRRRHRRSRRLRVCAPGRGRPCRSDSSLVGCVPHHTQLQERWPSPVASSTRRRHQKDDRSSTVRQRSRRGGQ